MHQDAMVAVTFKQHILHTDKIEFENGQRDTVATIEVDSLGLMNGGIASVSVYDT